MDEDARNGHHEIVVMGASMGGIEAIGNLLQQLPPDLPAAVFVVQHITPRASTLLNRVLGRNSKLPVTFAQSGATIVQGNVYVAPPDEHLLVGEGHMTVIRGPRENRVRPAIDPLFRSAAVA